MKKRIGTILLTGVVISTLMGCDKDFNQKKDISSEKVVETKVGGMEDITTCDYDKVRFDNAVAIVEECKNKYKINCRMSSESDNNFVVIFEGEKEKLEGNIANIKKDLSKIEKYNKVKFAFVQEGASYTERFYEETINF